MENNKKLLVFDFGSGSSTQFQEQEVREIVKIKENDDEQDLKNELAEENANQGIEMELEVVDEVEVILEVSKLNSWAMIKRVLSGENLKTV